jgi:hypothetical protein
LSAWARDSRVPLAVSRSTLPKYASASGGSISHNGPAEPGPDLLQVQDVRGDRPIRQPRRSPGQHETGQHIGLQRRQILRRHRRPRHPQVSYHGQAQTWAS